jgi:hypothetical protein
MDFRATKVIYKQLIAEKIKDNVSDVTYRTLEGCGNKGITPEEASHKLVYIAGERGYISQIFAWYGTTFLHDDYGRELYIKPAIKFTS